MGLPFKKKKKTGLAATELDQANEANLQETKKKKNKRFRLKVSVRRLFSRSKKGAASVDPVQEGTGEVSAGEQVEAVEKAQKEAEKLARKKEKQEKKANRARVKKEKRQRKALAKKQKKVQSGKDEKKDKLRLILIVAGIALLIIAIVLVVVLFVFNGGKSVEERLQEAAEYIGNEEYDQAEAIYNELLEEDSTLVDVYVGLGEIALARQDQEGAISILEQGYAAIGGARIEQMLLEIDPSRAGEQTVGTVTPESTVEPIAWTDASFEQMLRQAMGLDASTPIMPEDLQEITTLKIMGGTHAGANNPVNAMNTLEGYTIDGTMYTARGAIRSLDDLQYFPNLTKLTIGYNQVEDIQGIANLTNLETLGLYCNGITDISALSGLTNLKYLYLYDNEIADLSPLSGLTNLQTLYLQNNNIQDISALSGLTQLQDLYLNSNAIEDISAVRSMSQLYLLYAEDNQISDISVLAEMDALTDVSFVGNPVNDYSPAGHIRNVNREYAQ